MSIYIINGFLNLTLFVIAINFIEKTSLLLNIENNVYPPRDRKT